MSLLAMFRVYNKWDTVSSALCGIARA
jgi:hypothetical protein